MVVTAEGGAVLRNGEAMGDVQSGGSDFVMVFEAGCAVRLEGRPQQPVRQGSAIGRMSRPT